LVRPISRRQIGRDYVTAAASFAYLGDDTVGFSRATAVMDENLRTGGGECHSAGEADAAGGAGDECGFSGEIGHDRLPCCLKGHGYSWCPRIDGGQERRDITHEEFGILVVRAVRGVGVNDKLRARQMLLQDE